LYCTLEPCCHVGRTPPCTDLIIASGVGRVVASVEDPNPRVAGKGIAQLRAHGIVVDVGAGRDAAARLNRPFFSAVRRKRPYVLAKAAVSLDLCVAAEGGRPVAMTAAEANRRSQSLRAEVDAIAVGSGTMMADDPLLTAREVYRARPLVRVVLDRRLRLSPSARVFGTRDHGPIVVVTRESGESGWLGRSQALERAGAVLLMNRGPGLGRALEALTADHGVQALLLEGGPAIQRAAAGEGLVDALRLIVAPRVIGPHGVPWIGWPALSATGLERVSVCGPDVILDRDVYWTD
jgi:diaminohydroxyphosphoribosylaminopyrimidine deaminase/5-amino-6-(5-phosphoribosylamino)uracil reductase